MSRWPISWAELEPWYAIAAGELGRDYSILDWDAPGLPGLRVRPFSTEPPARYGDEAGEPIWQDERVHVVLNTTLSRLVARSDRRAIEGVTLYSEQNGARTFSLETAQRVVLAAGGMGNPQILLASGSDGAASVGNESDQVGRYLMEHPHFYDCAKMVVRESVQIPDPPRTFGEFRTALVPDDAAFEALGSRDVSFEVTETGAEDDDAIERFVISQLGGSARVYSLTARSEMDADPENRVERMSGSDPAGLPRLRATCVLNADDLRTVLGHLHLMGETLATGEIGRVAIRNHSIFNELNGGGHIMGTTRMGVDPTTSVTDGNCRVHGYANLFVAGSSLFPSGGYANPTLTIVALAARLGDHLAGEA
jgi:choline dehydrogenase-like flavoprotein